MKTKEFKKLKTKMALLASLKIIFYSIIVMLFFFFIIDFIFNDYLANLVVSNDRMLYYFCVSHKSDIVNVFLLLTCFIISFFVYRNMNDSLVEVVKGLDNVLNNPNNEVCLNNSLSLIERMLNSIRVNLITSKNREKELIQKKNDLIMYMAHDLKTPLTSVIGYLTLLNDEKDINEEVKNKYINIALKKSIRLEELTNQFFEITRYNLSEMTINSNNIDLSVLINQLIDEFYPSLQEKKLDINVIKNDHIPFIGDGDKLARAFGNLIRNAISYSYCNSSIVIEVLDLEDKIILFFKNKGEKIPQYKLDKLFDKFYRADESRNSNLGGSGLGLAITKEIILLHKGDIFASNDGEYIIFKIILNKK